MKPRIILWLLSLIALVSVSAQNRIDYFVDNQNIVGSSKFTSVVERDPKTHEVVRVVKVREITRALDIDACLDLFEAEKKTGRFSHNIDGSDHHTLILAIEGARQDRIYMLQYTGSRPMQGHDGKVTIVIKMKK
ncbi:MAG: DUF5024 domain-containing protein [Bacteroidaceae bacterium]|nr:DUF5024 domain-containing protein [Bacteroidaceae bacterium]